MQQFYFHSEFLNNGLRQNIRPIKVQGQALLCLSNDNVIQFYSYVANGIAHHSRHNFKCNIAKLQVLQSKHHANDYLFIIDRKGRYAFWHKDIGFDFVQNRMMQMEYRNNLYKMNSCEEDESIFSGQIHTFDVHDTKGMIFYNRGHILVLIDYTINRVGLKIQKIKKVQILYVKFKFMAWIGHRKNSRLLGIIQEIDEKTIFKIHNVDSSSKLNDQNVDFKFEKMNLIQFTVNSKNQILLLTNSEVIVLKQKNYQLVCTHKIHHSFGRLVDLNCQISGYLGEELILFNENNIKSYGSLTFDNKNLLEGKGVLEVTFLSVLADGGRLIAVSTFSNQIYLIVLYEDTWKLYHQIRGITPIFSLHATNNSNALVAVTNSSIDHYSVVVIQKQQQLPIFREQAYEEVIQQIFSLSGGQYLIIASRQSNHIMKYESNNKEYAYYFDLPNERIIYAQDRFMVTEQSIFWLQFEQKRYQQLVREKIVLAQINQKCLVYLNDQGDVSKIDSSSHQIDTMRAGAINQYCWCLLPNQSLVVASVAHNYKLIIYLGSQISSEIELKDTTLISAMSHYKIETQNSVTLWFLVVGFINGRIQVYNDKNIMVAEFCESGCEPIKFFSIGVDTQLLGVISGSKQYLLKCEEGKWKLDRIMFSNKDNYIFAIVYARCFNSFIFVEKSEFESRPLIKTVSMPSIILNEKSCMSNDCSYQMRTVAEYDDEIPVVLVKGGYIYVGIKQSLVLYDLVTGRLLKKQTNYLRDVIGIQILNYGLLVYGIDLLQRNILLVIEQKELQLLGTINLILKDSKYIKEIRSIPGTNKLICKSQKYLHLYEITDVNEINQIFELKTDMQGYSLDINSQHQLLVTTDSFRLIVLYSYQINILPIARYVASHEVNDFVLMNRCLVYGDKEGKITFLEFNVQNQNQVIRTSMTEVASIGLGQQISVLSKINQLTAYYGTINGKVGLLKLITQQDYILLKETEIEVFKNISKSHDFDYQLWRNRNPENNKLIDGTLIKQFLKLNRNTFFEGNEKNRYEQIAKVYQSLTQ